MRIQFSARVKLLTVHFKDYERACPGDRALIRVGCLFVFSHVTHCALKWIYQSRQLFVNRYTKIAVQKEGEPWTEDFFFKGRRSQIYSPISRALVLGYQDSRLKQSCHSFIPRTAGVVIEK